MQIMLKLLLHCYIDKHDIKSCMSILFIVNISKINYFLFKFTIQKSYRTECSINTVTEFFAYI